MADKKTKIPISTLNVGDKLGEGGTAEVFSALNGGGQVVLRRLLPRHKFRGKMRKRFLNGVEVRRRCGEHPNIVRYFGEGGSFFSAPYEVIEFVPGKNLKTLIFNKHAAVHDQPLHILLQCAAAIMHVHQTGYLHLDIKPENFFVTFVDDKPVPKLSDFDLCLPISRTSAPKDFGGSLMYVPPEFLEKKEISIASDIFAFGVMAYNIYTNQMPFIGSVESLMKGTYEIKFPAGAAERIPDEVQEIIVKCLSRHPRVRYQSGGDLYSALEKARRNQSYRAQKQALG